MTAKLYTALSSDNLTEVAAIIRQTGEELERENKRKETIAMLDGWLADESDDAGQAEGLKATMDALDLIERRRSLAMELAMQSLHDIGQWDHDNQETLESQIGPRDPACNGER